MLFLGSQTSQTIQFIAISNQEYILNIYQCIYLVKTHLTQVSSFNI